MASPETLLWLAALITVAMVFLWTGVGIGYFLRVGEERLENWKPKNDG